MERPGIIKKTLNAVKTYKDERVNIAKKTIREVESKIRTGGPVIFEWSVPVGFSNEFGEKTKKERICAMRSALNQFDRVQRVSQNRVFK